MLKRKAEILKNKCGFLLGRISTFVAMSAVYVMMEDFPCFIIVGEPQIPEGLLKLKEEKYKDR